MLKDYITITEVKMSTFTRREKSYLLIALGELIHIRQDESESFLNVPNRELDEFFISEKKSYRKELRELDKLQKKIYDLDYKDFLKKGRK